MTKKPQRGLGRGLSALLAEVESYHAMPEGLAPNSPKNLGGEKIIPIEFLEPNSNQPRRHFDDEALEELAQSISQKGVVQPLIVRELAPNHYQIVAGERRWRAAQRVKLHELPVIVRDYTDAEVQEIALIENIQRENLNAIEEAEAYYALVEAYQHTQEALSQILGKSRSHIANMIRLLNLPDSVKEYVRQGRLSMGHARALLATDRPAALAESIVGKGLSVRDVEALVKRDALLGSDGPNVASIKNPKVKDADTLALQAELSAALESKVEIAHHANGTGILSIQYKDLETLDRLCALLGHHN